MTNLFHKHDMARNETILKHFLALLFYIKNLKVSREIEIDVKKHLKKKKEEKLANFFEMCSMMRSLELLSVAQRGQKSLVFITN